ncbi:MAG: HEPN domain-containing protein [Rhodomicrobium sp.]
MKEAAAAYPAKARQTLDKARRVHAIGLCDEAGRLAYYAAFHAAQALLFERTDKVYATHQGVKAEFARLAKSDGRIERKHSTFLARAYSLKSAADYETGAAANVTEAQASEAIGLAEEFVSVIGGIAWE